MHACTELTTTTQEPHHDAPRPYKSHLKVSPFCSEAMMHPIITPPKPTYTVPTKSAITDTQHKLDTHTIAKL